MDHLPARSVSPDDYFYCIRLRHMSGLKPLMRPAFLQDLPPFLPSPRLLSLLSRCSNSLQLEQVREEREITIGPERDSSDSRETT